MADLPKYAAIEIERRWVVDLAAVGDLSSIPYREIEDLYFDDSRLRLRRVTSPDGAIVFKFGKKYGKRTATSEPVTNLYLTEGEYVRLSSLGGAAISKRRYSLERGALDVYVRPRIGFAVFEMEFDDEASAQAYSPPSFVMREITGQLSFDGPTLSTAYVV